MLEKITPLQELIDLSDKACIVTGAAKGIGRGIAMRLGSAGAKVLIADLDDDNGLRAAELVTEQGGEGAFLKVDSSSPKDAAKTVEHCAELWGGVDILVNNAGIYPPADALKMTPEQWRKVLALNLDGTFFNAQAAARWMVDHKRPGSIVNIASIDALHPTGNLVHYDASKAGVVMMTRSLAAALGTHGIRVNSVLPGGINTPGATKVKHNLASQLGTTTEAFDEAFIQHTPRGRMGEPDDIARAVLFLVSPLADYITGSKIVVDGGYLLQ